MVLFELEVKDRNPSLLSQLTKVWELSVLATHSFLSLGEVESIKKYVPASIYEVQHLIVATDENDVPIAFMGIENQRLEMLFINPINRGKELGRLLLEYGFENFSVNEVTVNEQNPQARGFYEHMGFKVYKRTHLDEQGNPYPLLYMRRSWCIFILRSQKLYNFI